MRIAFLTSHMTFYGGGSIVVRNYANALAREGHKITIIAIKIDKTKYIFDNNIRLIELGGILPSNPFYWLFLLFGIKKRFISALSNNYFDIIIPQGFPVNYFCTCLKRQNFGKNIFFCHEPYRFFHEKKFISSIPIVMRVLIIVLKLFYKKYDIIGGKRADSIICNSNFTKQRVRKIYDRDSEIVYPFPKLLLSNQGISEIRSELKIESEAPIIFTLGLSSYLKGARELMIIFKKVLEKNEDTILLIGGKISKENQKIIQKMKKKLKIPEKNLVLCGFIPDEKLPEFYSAATITYYTAIDEAFGLIPVESMACGTPVIAFEGGPSESIIHGKTGYIIKTYDYDDFCDKTFTLINNPSLWQRFSTAAKKHALSNCSFEKGFEEFYRLIKRPSQLKIRIARTSPHFNSIVGGGVAKSLRAIIRNTSPIHSTSLLTTNAGYQKNVKIIFQRDSLKIYLDKQIIHYRNYIITPLTLLNLIRIQPDIIHIHSCRNFQGDIALIYGILKKKPIIISPHGSLIEHRSDTIINVLKQLHDYILKSLYIRFVKIWIATSSGEADDLRQYIGTNAHSAKILEILLGVDKDISFSANDVKEFSTKYLLENRFVISYVGGIHKRKGIQYVLYALHELKFRISNILFLIIGPNTGYLPTVQKLIQALNLEENVKVLGFLEKKPAQLYAAYACSKIIIIPSRFENFGHVFVEAAILKAPVITSAEYTNVYNESDVFKYRYGNIAELKRLIIELYENNNLLIKKANKFHEDVMKMDTWRDMMLKYEKIYKKLVFYQ